MACDNKSNFEKMAEKGRQLFLTYDRTVPAGKYGTAFDDDYLYIGFLGRKYRISRDTGTAEASCGQAKGDFSEVTPAGPGEALIFYDIFCFGDPGASASGEFINHDSLVNELAAASNPGDGLSSRYREAFTGKAEELRAACGRLGGAFTDKADLTCDLPLFEFLPCRFQFWDADDEFPASVIVFFDKNILKFMHFETTWYVSECLLDRIRREAALRFPHI